MEQSTLASSYDNPQVAEQAKNLTKAIFQTESGGDYNVKGKSGESGAGQWTPETWKAQAKDVLGNESAPMTTDNQSVVAQGTIRKLIGQGKNAAQIAAIWNSGSDTGWENKIGVNSHGVEYNVPKYVKSVTDAYQTLKQGGQVNADPNNPSSTANQTPVAPSSATPEKGIAQKALEFAFPILENKPRTTLQTLGDLGLSAMWFVPGLGEAGGLLRGGELAAKGLEGANLAVKGMKAIETAAPVAKASIPALIGKGAATGYGIDVASNLSSGKTGGEALTPGFGTVTGGVLGGVGGKIAQKVASKAGETPVGRLEAQTTRLKTLQKAFRENSSKSANPITTMRDNDFFKHLQIDENGRINTEGLTNQNHTGAIDNAIEGHSQDASKLIESLPGGAPTKLFEQDVLDTIKKDPILKRSGRINKALAEAKSRFASFKDSYGKEIPWPEIDGIRVEMNKVWDPEVRDVARVMGDLTRTYLKKGSPKMGMNAATNKAIGTALDAESELIRARNFVQKLHGTAAPGGMKKFFEGLVGTAIGGLAGLSSGPLTGAAMGYIGKKIGEGLANRSQSRYFKPALLSKPAGLVQKALQSKTGQKATGLLQKGLIRGATGQ